MVVGVGCLRVTFSFHTAKSVNQFNAKKKEKKVGTKYSL